MIISSVISTPFLTIFLTRDKMLNEKFCRSISCICILDINEDFRAIKSETDILEINREKGTDFPILYK